MRILQSKPTTTTTIIRMNTISYYSVLVYIRIYANRGIVNNYYLTFFKSIQMNATDITKSIIIIFTNGVTKWRALLNNMLQIRFLIVAASLEEGSSIT